VVVVFHESWGENIISLKFQFSLLGINY